MAVESEISTKTYSPGAAMAAEALTGIVFHDPDHLVVEHWASGAASGTLLVRDVDYTIAGNGAAAAGTITAIDAYPVADQFRIRRETPAVQQTELPAFGPLPSAALEGALDKMALRDQEQQREIDRAPKFPRGVARRDFADGLAVGDALYVNPDGKIAGTPNDVAGTATNADRAEAALAAITPVAAQVTLDAAAVDADKVIVTNLVADAEDAADVITAAFLNGDAFTDTTVAAAITAGLAAAAEGEYFIATGDDIDEVRQYQDVAGVATLIFAVPKIGVLEALVALAEGFADEAQAAAALRPYFGSAMFPFENGRTLDPAKNGQRTLAGFRTIAAGTGSATDYWRDAYSCLAICDPHRMRSDAQNYVPHVFGTNHNSSTNRSTYLRYNPDAVNNNKRTFEFSVRGESAVGTWLIRSAQLPFSSRGPYAVLPYHDGTNGYLHVFDIGSRTWYDGSAVAKPASWLGVSTNALGSELVIGSVGNRAFPFDNSAAWQNAAQWRGSIGDILFANTALTKADVEAIVDGAAPVATAVARGATVHCHVPMVEDGKLSATVATTFSGITLTTQGTLMAGPTLRRQSTDSWIMLELGEYPRHFPVEYGETHARVRIKGETAGLTGKIMARIVLANGQVWYGWHPTQIPVVGGLFDGHIMIPEFLGKAELQVAMSSDLSVIATVGRDCQSGPVIDQFGQSELVRATNFGASAFGNPSVLNPSLPFNSETIVFAEIVTDNTSYAMKSAQAQPGFLGDGCVGIINAIRAITPRSVLIRNHARSGTSLLSLMNDDDTSRRWGEVEGLCNMTSARGPNGEWISTGVIMVGWEAFFGPGDVMTGAYQPFFTGMASSSIAQEDIDHWLFDGSFSPTLQIVVQPCNRRATATGASDTSEDDEADQRDQMRNAGHRFGYIVGHESMAHMMEGEVAAGGLPSGSSVTHSEAGVYEGNFETGVIVGRDIADTISLSAQYPGPVFFRSTGRPGTSETKVIVRLDDPRPYPGLGLSDNASGYSSDPQVVKRNALRLHPKKVGGDPGATFEARRQPSGGSYGAWSKLNVVSGVILGGREVELTTVWTLEEGDIVQVRHCPGGGGVYSEATITQEEWRAGCLYWSGEACAADGPSSVDDVVRLGAQVAGSNQPITISI